MPGQRSIFKLHVVFPAALFLLGASELFAQSELRSLYSSQWSVTSDESKVALFVTGLGNASNSEERALALAGIRRLANENRAFIQERISVAEIQRAIDDSDAEVVRQAIQAYSAYTNDDVETEQAIIQKVHRGSHPLEDLDYIRYLRPYGISSVEAQEWLLSLAMGPVSDTKFLAVEALVLEDEHPPEILLPYLMELIRSPEFFCHPNLTQFLPNFTEANDYIEELRDLREDLLIRISSDSNRRLSGSTILTVEELNVLDETIGSISSGKN